MAKKRRITFTIEISDDGETAELRLPEGRGKERDAAKVADLTIAIADAIGPVVERHIGDHDHHHHDHHHGHDHTHNHGKA